MSRNPTPSKTLQRLRASLRLLPWLGPWASDDNIPLHVQRRALTLAPQRAGHSPLRAWLYTPTDQKPIGALMIAQGLFPLGPEDRRLERISRIFASAGMLVLTPSLPDFMSLRLTSRVIEDMDQAFGALLELSERPVGVRPGILSVSFGSLPALRVAALPHRREQVGGLAIWGGYADWRETMHFAFTGQVEGRRVKSHDPTNHPVIFMNLIEQMPNVPVAPERLIQAWRRFVLATWNQPEQKARFQEVAREIAQELPREGRNLFMMGCGARKGGYSLCMRLLSQARDELLDPRPHLEGLRCPVALIHARNDDVIPANQLRRLRDAMPPHVPVSTYLTGLYGHSGGRGQGGGGLPLTPALFREAWSLAGILRSLARTATAVHEARGGEEAWRRPARVQVEGGTA